MRPKRIVVAVTGASGSVYAERMILALLKLDFEIHLIFSDAGKEVFFQERDIKITGNLDELFKNFFGVQTGKIFYYSVKEIGSSLASGSFRTFGMVVVPCTMKTLSGIANGSSQNLIERAADVTLKEKRRLILVPRETPVSKIHLKNMLACSEAGADIVLASPGFYYKPKTIEEIGDFIVARILNLLNIENDLLDEWKT
ncbi:UbiX family flavin prenyltransferase [bacterium]|nr:UbiX family flavin prenyltransferase [bacterium]